MPFGDALILRGSLERLTPVLMTAAAASFALLPLLVDAGRGRTRKSFIRSPS